jgi:aminobenzoyl-glutamate transport protein
VSEPQIAPRSGLGRALDLLERAGNRLPDPATIFLGMALLVVAVSWIASQLGAQVAHPSDGSTIAVQNLLTRENLRRMWTEAIRNFTGFAPLGLVLVAMLGMGVAEGSGLVAAAMRGFVLRVPRRMLGAAIVFMGINANLAADAGLVVLPPLAGLLFHAAGRHPVAGIAAAFAGVAGGFSANLLPSPLDALLVGLSQSALDASKLLPGYTVGILGNWFFLIGSTFLLTALGTWVTEKVVEPRLGPWRGERGVAEAPDARETRALRAAGLTTLACLGVFAAFTLAPGAPLRLDEGRGLDAYRPMFESMVMMLTLVFLLPGLAYGIVAGTIRNDKDVAKMMGDSMSSMGTYIVLAFVAAQFVSWFSWSNLAAVLAVSGAQALKALNFGGPLLMVGLVIASAALNLFTTSASAKWAYMAPLFVPMLVLLGFSPEGTQVIYRVGDSCTNIITPLMPYMPFILAAVRRYDPNAGMGTLIALMIPYSIAFLTSWILLLLAWHTLGWPIGPGVYMMLPAPPPATAP